MNYSRIGVTLKQFGKIVLAGLVVLLWSGSMSPAAAQEEGSGKSGFLLGFTAGATVSTGLYEKLDGPKPPTFNPLVFPAGGLTFDWRMSNWFSLQNSFLYKSKSDKINVKSWGEVFQAELQGNWDPAFTLAGEGFVKSDIRYLEWSLCPTFVIARSIEIGLGGFIGVGISGKRTEDYSINYLWNGEPLDSKTVQSEKPAGFSLIYETEETDPETLPVNRLDYGILGRLGLRLGPMTLGGSLSYSMNPIEPSYYDPFGVVEPDTETKIISGMLSLTFLIGKRN